MVQTQVYSTLARGIAGEYADDGPHREYGYILKANTIEGAAATATISMTANPTSGATITIGSVTYTFVNEPAAANELKIGDSLEATVYTLTATINGDGTVGTDYYEGTTTPLGFVIADAQDQNTIKLTATEEGVSGNAIALAASEATVTAFSGGVDETVYLPTISYAFTHTDENGVTQVGGTGEFAGVLVNPKLYANYLNLQPVMTLPSGIQGGLSTFGNIYIQPESAFEIGFVAAYDNLTGKINAYVNEDAVPSGFTVIPNAKFAKYSGAAGEVAILQLGN